MYNLFDKRFDPVQAFAQLSLEEEGVLYTQQRDLLYKGDGNKQINVPCEVIHAQLKLAENTARQALLGDNPQYKGNLAAANIGFITSSHPYDSHGKTHSRHFITIPLHFARDWDDPHEKHNLTAQIKDFWEKEDIEKVQTTTAKGSPRNIQRNPSQLTRQQRACHYASKDGSNYRTQYQAYPFDEYYNSSGPKLEQDFHHSEQTIYEMLEKPEVISYYINYFLTAYNILPGDKIYALILDIYTTRYMCQGCADRAYATAHYPGRSLLIKWQKKLSELGYRVPKTGLRMAIRVTGEGPALHQHVLMPAHYKQQLNIWTLNPGRSTVNSIVMEADARHLPPLAIPHLPINDLFRRTIFLSTEGKSDLGLIQDAAIESFGDFLLKFKKDNHNLCNPMLLQNRIPHTKILKILDKLIPKIKRTISEDPRERKRLAQDIYLRGEGHLTGEEFYGLFFI